MPTEITIRPGTIDDVPLIFSFIQELADYEKLSHEVKATEATLRETLFGAKPAAEVVIASIDGVAQGWALFFQNFSTFMGRPGLYVEDLYVRPNARGQGIGEKILRHLAKLAKQRQCARLEWIVLDWNEPAIRFYRRIGAKGLDEWTIQRVTGEALDKLAQD